MLAIVTCPKQLTDEKPDDTSSRTHGRTALMKIGQIDKSTIDKKIRKSEKAKEISLVDTGH